MELDKNSTKSKTTRKQAKPSLEQKLFAKPAALKAVTQPASPKNSNSPIKTANNSKNKDNQSVNWEDPMLK